MEKKGAKYLTIAGAILIVLGMFDTFMLIRAVMIKSSYTGGSIIYIIVGILLIRQNKTAYTIVKYIGLPLLILCFSGMYSFIFSNCLKIYSGIVSDLSINFNYAMYAYMILVFVEMALVWHPETQKIFSDKVAGTKITTLFMGKKIFIICTLISIAFFILLYGPNLARNSYSIGRAEIERHYKDNFNKKNHHKLILMSEQTHNWTFYSRWKIVATGGEVFYQIEISPKNNITISYFNNNPLLTNKYFESMMTLRRPDVESIKIHQYDDSVRHFSKDKIDFKTGKLIKDGNIDSYLRLLQTNFPPGKQDFIRYNKTYYVLGSSRKNTLFEYIIKIKDNNTLIIPFKMFSNVYGGVTYYYSGSFFTNSPNVFTNIDKSDFKMIN